MYVSKGDFIKIRNKMFFMAYEEDEIYPYHLIDMSKGKIIACFDEEPSTQEVEEAVRGKIQRVFSTKEISFIYGNVEMIG